MIAFTGLRIIESEACVEQFRFPRSRKKRIRNKWAKRPRNFRPIVDRGFQMNGAIVCHPIFAAVLRKKLGGAR